MNQRIRIVAVLLAAGLGSGAVHAEGFVSVRPGSGVLSLDLAPVGAATVGAGAASVVAGPFTIAGTGSGTVVGDASATTLGGNGIWQAVSPWADTPSGPAAGAFVNGLQFGDNSVSFSLSPGQSTSFVGFRYMVDTSAAPAGDLVLAVFDGSGTVIATSTVLSPVSSGGINESAYIGYMSDAGAIASFRVDGAYHVYGDVGYAQPVPEPEQWAFMMAGLTAAAALARRRRAVRTL